MIDNGTTTVTVIRARHRHRVAPEREEMPGDDVAAAGHWDVRCWTSRRPT